MRKIALVYGTSSGTTEEVARTIQARLEGVALFNAESVLIEDLEPFDFYIFGSSTAGIGDLQDDWEMLLPRVEKMNLKGKKVALFGLGDSASFSTSFAGGMYIIYKALLGKVEFVGSVSPEGYTFDDSEALIDDRFVGLPLDEDNEYKETEGRINAWIEELKKHL